MLKRLEASLRQLDAGIGALRNDWQNEHARLTTMAKQISQHVQSPHNTLAILPFQLQPNIHQEIDRINRQLDQLETSRSALCRRIQKLYLEAESLESMKQQQLRRHSLEMVRQECRLQDEMATLQWRESKYMSGSQENPVDD
jgi:cysteinyl-tRNA synthetase